MTGGSRPEAGPFLIRVIFLASGGGGLYAPHAAELFGGFGMGLVAEL
jgi:hypothetical protein